jgi:hypothetical protein
MNMNPFNPTPRQTAILTNIQEPDIPNENEKKMIDITISDDGIEIDMWKMSIKTTDDLVRTIQLIIDKAKYSGETITLWKVEGEMKKLVNNW